MKRHNKTIKKGMAIATSAMLVMPTSTIGFAQEQSTNSPTSKNVVSAQQILENPPSTATPAKDAMNVYTSFTKGNSNNSGNGSIDNPYNRFEDAVAKVANGGTIYIKGEAFLNDVGNNLPFLIDKNITIKTVDGQNNASLSVRSAGIILGANVKFENISLDFANKHHDSIFANGYTLDLINVTRSSGSRDIDLFAGGLYNLADGTQVHPSGNKGVINVETNGSFKGGELESDFGNIYAGSMNGAFNGSAEINVSRKDKSKKLVIGAIKSSGALEAATGSMLDTTEPLPPAENPSQFPMNGEVSINLDNYQVSVDGTTGSNSKTSVTTSTEYLNTLELKNVDHLKVESGEIQAVYENTDANTIPNITLGEKAVLDLSQAGIVDVENYNGNGTITLGKNGKLNITNSVNGSINFQTEGAWNGESGKVKEDHVYITTPNKDAVISFVPHYSQSYLELSGRTNGSIVEWVTQEIGKDNTGDDTADLIEINCFEIEAEHTVTQEDANKKGYGVVKIPFTASVNADPADLDAVVDLNEYPLEITVNGKKAVYREDENGIGAHYFVEDLGLAMYFTSETFFDEHELVVIGYTADGNQVAIETGEYEINVLHKKNDGTTIGFTSNLTVTGEVETPEDEEEEVTPPSDEEIKPETPPTDEGDKEEDTNTPEEDETPSDEVTPEKVEADKDGWLKTNTIGKVAYLWDYTIDKETNTITLKKFKGNNELSGDIKVEIPKSVEGYKVALENLNNETFQHVNHIRVAEGEGQVKLLATELVRSFENNSDLKYVDLKGLDVSEVTDMTMLFSMCPNLRVINILGWDIQESTIITGMFYAKMNATDEEKKILVIADSEKFNDYNFGDFSGEELVGDNRLPSVVTFNANGGYFFNPDDDILNMKIPNYIINTDVLAELDGIIDYYLEQISEPIQEGYKLKGWFTEDKEPTNVYELLNMTYKAQWEKVKEDTETQPTPPDTPNGDEGNKGEGGTDTEPPAVDKEESKPPINGDIVIPPTMEPKPEDKPEVEEKPEVNPEEKPETKPEVTNGIENLKDYDKELQEKVDSLIAESTIDKQQELVLSIVGDDSDLDNVSHVEVTKDGIFAVVDGERLKFEVELDGLNLDLTQSRAIRVNASRNSIVKYSVVAHKNIEDGLKITSNNLENILITSKVAEPFTDVIDTDWFKGYVEEAYNYGFTQGTSDTTYSPQKKITRAQFAVMIARALELSEHETELPITLSDLKGKSYAQQVQQLVEAGIITGYKDQSFKGSNELTRQQAAVMLTRLLNYLGVDTTVKGDIQLKDLSSVSSYAQQSVRYLAEKRIIVSGENVAFNPQGKLTRAQMAKMIVQTLKLTSKY